MWWFGEVEVAVGAAGVARLLTGATGTPDAATGKFCIIGPRVELLCLAPHLYSSKYSTTTSFGALRRYGRLVTPDLAVYEMKRAHNSFSAAEHSPAIRTCMALGAVSDHIVRSIAGQCE